MEAYLPENLTQVKWARAVNSLTELKISLENENLRMIEGDIEMGYMNLNNLELVPLMSHPTKSSKTTIPDLSFKDFLQRVSEWNINQAMSKRKGIKLDFKSIESVEPCLKILSRYNQSLLQFPIWIHGNKVLKGPINATTEPIDDNTFLTLAKKYFPIGTLSLSWATRFNSEIYYGSYTMEHINEMINLLKHHEIPAITPMNYIVHAGLAVQSIDSMMYLIQESDKNWPNSTLAIWSGENDSLDTKLLVQLLDKVGRNKCFLDLPDIFDNIIF